MTARKKAKGKPIFTLRSTETGGFEVQVEPRNEDPGHTHQFAIEAAAHIWIRENFDRFSA